MLVALVAVPALAQTGPLQPAPVPAIGAPKVQPSQRVPGAGPQAAAAGPVNATPFSGGPTQSLTYGDQADPHSAANAKGDLVNAPRVSR